MKIPIVIILCSLFLTLAGCNDAPESEAAIAAAIDSHLARRTNMNAMQVDITEIQFEGDEATATVILTARADPAASMQMIYQLTRTGDAWEVQDPRTEEGSADGASHGSGMGGPPPGHQAVAGEPDNTIELPSGHPSLNESQPQADVPEQHPPVSN